MARHTKLEVIKKIVESGIIPVFFFPDLTTVKKISNACADGGAMVLEFTNRGDKAFELFGKLIEWRDTASPELVIGAGTIIDAPTASIYVNNGAEFIVGPNFNPEVAQICNRRKILYVPGCMTPSEISNAEQSGADIIKVFPARVLTPFFIKAFLGPSPHSKLLPSGGITFRKEDVQGWIKAGATAINLGTDLISNDIIAKGDFQKLANMTHDCITWVKEARGQASSF